MFVSNKTLFFSLLIAATIISAFLIERKLHHFASSPLGHFVGILGSFFILLVFLYPIRKYIFQIGNMKEWLDWHMFFGITGPLLVLIHGAFHFHALVSTLVSLVMVVNVMSGLVGRYLYMDARKALQAKEAELKKKGLSPKDLEEALLLEAASVNIMGKWRLVHYPIAASFLALMIYHIISVLYFKGV